jgi:uncharacterized membrane protein YfcA
MADVASFLLLSAAVFVGAFVSGLAGFAFSAAAGVILLHVLAPQEAVPLMMACSLGVQATTLYVLRKNIAWNGCAALIIGGLLGTPVAVWLLQTADPRIFREVFGAIVAAYAAFMIFKPGAAYLQEMRQHRNALIGFGGGLIGGLTAMPGALPTIWCDIHGLPKNQQRGFVQPFIVLMQVFALALMLVHNGNAFSTKIFYSLLLSIPALVAGTTLGSLTFHVVEERTFRRIILGILLVSGVSLIV